MMSVAPGGDAASAQLDLSSAPSAWVGTDVSGPLASDVGASGPGALPIPQTVAALPIDTDTDPARFCPGVDLTYCLARTRLLQGSTGTTPTGTQVYGTDRYTRSGVPLSDFGSAVSLDLLPTRSTYIP